MNVNSCDSTECHFVGIVTSVFYDDSFWNAEISLSMMFRMSLHQSRFRKQRNCIASLPMWESLFTNLVCIRLRKRRDLPRSPRWTQQRTLHALENALISLIILYDNIHCIEVTNCNCHSYIVFLLDVGLKLFVARRVLKLFSTVLLMIENL